MYAYIKGVISQKSPTLVYLETGGIAYAIHISLNTYSKIETLEEATLYTYLHVKEDALTLYGFADEDEKDLFILLLSVSGIGPNTARIILSSMTPGEVGQAILSENDLAFKKVKGVGPKTAKRLILDLRDKIIKIDTTGSAAPRMAEDVTDEAVKALVGLGFQKSKVRQTVDNIRAKGEFSLEEMVKLALQKLTGH